MRKSFLSVMFLLLASWLPLFSAPPLSQVSVRVEPSAFSPNGDGIKDDTFIAPVVRSNLPVARWRLDIMRDRKLVARMTGSGFSALIKWDGRDRKGVFVPDG